MRRHYWVLKTEPSTFSYADLEREKKTAWTGVRNFEARNNLRAMRPGDLALVYHSGTESAVVGVARVLTAAAPDPTARGEDWSKVDCSAVERFASPVGLSTLKATPGFSALSLVRRPRLSVAPVEKAAFDRIVRLGRSTGLSRSGTRRAAHP